MTMEFLTNLQKTRANRYLEKRRDNIISTEPYTESPPFHGFFRRSVEIVKSMTMNVGTNLGEP